MKRETEKSDPEVAIAIGVVGAVAWFIVSLAFDLSMGSFDQFKDDSMTVEIGGFIIASIILSCFFTGLVIWYFARYLLEEKCLSGRYGILGGAVASVLIILASVSISLLTGEAMPALSLPYPFFNLAAVIMAAIALCGGAMRVIEILRANW